jgi:hypothetical protein
MPSTHLPWNDRQQPRQSLYKRLHRALSDVTDALLHALHWLVGIAVLALCLLGIVVWLALSGPRQSEAPKAPERIIEDHSTPLDRTALLTPLDAIWQTSQVLQVGKVRLRVFITSSDMSFELGAINQLRLAGQPVGVSELVSPVLLSSMSACKALVVMGAASQEGGSDIEAQRARQRSDWVQYQLWRSGQVRCPLYTLNLGKAWPKATPRATTEHQRRLMVLTVLDAPTEALSTGDNLSRALRTALWGIQGLPVNPVADYPLFELSRRH